MPRSNLFPLLILVLALGAALPARFVILAEESTVTVSGTSTLHDWSCEVETVAGWVESAEPANTLTSGQVVVAVDGIECGKRVMNRKMQDALRGDANPEIRFKSQKVVKSGDGWLATGTLEIAGTAHPLEVPLTITQDNGRFRLIGDVELSLEALGIDAPTAVLGTIKTGDLVTVTFNVIATS